MCILKEQTWLIRDKVKTLSLWVKLELEIMAYIEKCSEVAGIEASGKL